MAADAVEGVAIIGLSGRFPGAASVDAFWNNLRDGVESISFFTAEELRAEGLDPRLLHNPAYVNAGGILEAIDLFDAGFFGYNPREADSIDPQQRLFLECAWEGLEQAGYVPSTYEGLIGVFAGVGPNSYEEHIVSQPDVMALLGSMQISIGNEKDHVTTRVAYKLNLKGPSVTVQTACSTSLVAVGLACQALLTYQCDIALAGGASVSMRQKTGYIYQDGGIRSPDGHCRAFDAAARGTIGGCGVGVVVLKRLAEALADGDSIVAVIRGSAINNDGAQKVGYTAPSVAGQADVIAMAQAVAGVDPETITYIEAHGTATPLGDPIEIAALTEAFRARTERTGFCAIGSVKTNVGHLDTASGVAGLIKAALQLQHRTLVPSLNYQQPNPAIDFANSPFYVNTACRPWPDGPTPRRAGVSSFGIGGTNAHVVLEEAPPPPPAAPPRRLTHLLVLSARSRDALEAATAHLATYLQGHPDLALADVAYTLHVGRTAFQERRIVLCSTVEEAVERLRAADAHVATRRARTDDPPVAFLFPGQGAQYVDAARDLYGREDVFTAEVDRCAALLRTELGRDLRELLFPPASEATRAAEELAHTASTQPALFVLEYALARQWMQWGVHPRALIGHSIGEYVAACLAGVFALEDALRLVAARGRLMGTLPGGVMLAVSLPAAQLTPLLGEELALAAINRPDMVVVAGAEPAMERLERDLARRTVSFRRLHTSHAFHSPMMEPIMGPFEDLVAQTRRYPPRIPLIANLTGTWHTEESATDPRYWAQHLRHTVRFGDGLAELLRDPDRVLLEVGPGQSLSTLALGMPGRDREQAVLSTLPRARDGRAEGDAMIQTLGHLWQAGVAVDWAAFHEGERCRRVALPTYPFERQRHWIERRWQQPLAALTALAKKPEIADWFYVPGWRRTLAAGAVAPAVPGERWLLFADDRGVGARLGERLADLGYAVDMVAVADGPVQMGGRLEQRAQGGYRIDPRDPQSYTALVERLAQQGHEPAHIVHLFCLSRAPGAPAAQELGFYSLLWLAQALSKHRRGAPLTLTVLTDQVHDVTGDEALRCDQATVLGLLRVIPQEVPHVRCRSVDLVVPAQGAAEELIGQVVREMISGAAEPRVALRRAHRWVQTFNAEHLPEGGTAPLRRHGVYMITGGLGAVGMSLAEHLARAVQARLVLLGRRALPPREEWPRRDGHGALERAVQQVRALEALGAEVLTLRADVSDRAQMEAALAEVEQRFGALHGVVHAAGTVGAGAFRPLAETGRELCERQFAPKVQGTRVLAEALGDRPLDFVVLASSLSSVLGGLGFAAYASANAFMDAFAVAQRAASGRPWISIDWDGWHVGAVPGSPTGALAMAPREGVATFQRAIALGSAANLVVSTGDLTTRIAQWVTLDAVRQPQALVAPVPRHARPALDSAYQAPAAGLEQTVAHLWQELLGVAEIGVHDDFFELGGHSLLGIQFIARLRDALGVEVSVHQLFDAPTVARLCREIERSNPRLSDDVAAITDMLDLVEHLSDAQVALLLAADGDGGNGSRG